jgi:glyoxylase-like metal-dependent hydrolase (beta-lactamase superfamily II)
MKHSPARRPGLAPAIVLGLGALALLAALPAVAQRDFSDVEIEATHVAGTVYMLEGAGGNMGVSVGPDGLLLVDDQYAPLAEKIKAALGKLGEGKLEFVLNTHWHADHTGGNTTFGEIAPIIAHDNVRRRLATTQQVRGRTVEPLPPEGLPVITFEDSVKIHFNGEEIHVVHFPHAHTDGDSVVFFTGSNVVHMGDNLFSGWFPFVDLEAGGSVAGLIEATEKILSRLPEDVKIIAGHGPLSDRKGLETHLDMLKRTTAIVRERMAAGQSLEEIQEAGLPEEWAGWSWRFIDTDTWIEIVYNSYSG